MNRAILLTALLASAAPLAAKTIAVPPGADMREAIQTALLDAKSGDVVLLPAGTFSLTNSLSLDVDGVTVRGAGPDKTILSFKAQTQAGEGLLVTSSRVLLEGFAIEDTHGDGIKAKGADRISFKNLRVEWTGGAKATNGAYGVYPVTSTNVLIDHVTVRYCSDAGIYVGQSKNIVVRNSLVEFNVAGIEIENSMNADVHNNIAEHNTGGILVFDLPNLPQMGGHSTRIFNNRVINNDTPNFAAKGAIVASVPMGVGIMVMANRNVHVFGNTLDNNATAGVMIVAYPLAVEDVRYNPLPRNVFVGANGFGKSGWAPDFVGGKELAAAVGGALPPVVWDGVETWTVKGESKGQPATPGFVGGQLLSFGLVIASRDRTAAKPAMVAVATTPIETPSPVMLPSDQPGL